VQHGACLLARARGFTLLVVVTLALGIGTPTAIISFVRALFFNPLDVEDASRLVELHQTVAHRRELLAFGIALPDYWYYRDRAHRVGARRTLSHRAAASRGDASGDGDAVRRDLRKRGDCEPFLHAPCRGRLSASVNTLTQTETLAHAIGAFPPVDDVSDVWHWRCVARGRVQRSSLPVL